MVRWGEKRSRALGRGKEEESRSCMNNENMAGGGARERAGVLEQSPPNTEVTAMSVPLADGVSPSSHHLLG